MQELYGHCFFSAKDQARIMARADPPAVTSAAVHHALTAKRCVCSCFYGWSIHVLVYWGDWLLHSMSLMS